VTVTQSDKILHFPLHQKHSELGAKFGAFGEWEVPIYYSSILEEHNAVRERAGLFDVSHMGEIYISGSAAEKFLQELLPRNVASMIVGKACYMPLLNENGGIIDDIILYRLAGDEFLMIVNATNVRKDYDWIVKWKNRLANMCHGEILLKNETERKGLLALQGPNSAAIISKALGTAFVELNYYHLKPWDGGMIARTGYTGEDGFEIMVAIENLPQVWDRLVEFGKEFGLVPVGFGARDTLRLEAAMPLYGSEMDDQTSPLSVGIGWAVDFKKTSFVGREALFNQRKEGAEEILICFAMIDRGIPRHGYPIVLDGKRVGRVTSGGFSPTLQQNIGLGYVPAACAKSGMEFDVVIRDKPVRAHVVPLPFYKRKK